MKSRRKILLLLTLSVVIIFSAVWYIYDSQNQAMTNIFPAKASRDCAPWDGAAFTVTIQYDAETIIDISVWQSPTITMPSSFRFTDGEEQVANALIASGGGVFVPLRGTVWFERVEEGTPIEGRFRLTSERGELYEGGFVAEWESQMVYCG
ncbi:MAG: hypothetical protein MHPDNHAH_02228 [Anaerolineales bacterium]|nr:hypothetical protein [Anaerolineales bacterium]